MAEEDGGSVIRRSTEWQKLLESVSQISQLSYEMILPLRCASSQPLRRFHPLPTRAQGPRGVGAKATAGAHPKRSNFFCFWFFMSARPRPRPLYPRPYTSSSSSSWANHALRAHSPSPSLSPRLRPRTRLLYPRRRTSSSSSSIQTQCQKFRSSVDFELCFGSFNI